MVTIAPLPSSFFLSLPNVKELSVRSRILLIAHHLLQAGQTNFTVGELGKAFSKLGIPTPAKLKNQITRLSRGKQAPFISYGPGAYALSLFGQREVQDYVGGTNLAQPSHALRTLVGRISGSDEQRFLAEAIACFEVNALRATVVMSWAMTVDHLERYVLKKKLPDFNLASSKRNDKTPTVVVRDDFLEIRSEAVFIEILRSASIITKDVRKILDEKLGFRNTCAHPNDIAVSHSKVLSVLEDLVYNVILKYPL